MPTIRSLTLSDLADHADPWNDLWRRSDARLPSKRAEGIRLWCETFAPQSEFVAIVVLDGERFVAGLPLVREIRGKVLTTYRLPSNCTARSGDLLIDPRCEMDAALGLVVQQLVALRGGLGVFEEIDTASGRWQRFVEQLQRHGHAWHVSPGHDVGVIDIRHDWDAYTRSWSRNHRSALKRTRKKFEAAGSVQVTRLRDPSDRLLEETLDTCFEIENRTWKGENGTSILKTPGMAAYFHREARMMRDLGMLDLWLLKIDDQIIAFEYCQLSKTTCFSHKISFDPTWQRFSPGRLLRYYQLQQYHQDRSVHQLDTLGVHCQAKAKWTTRSYTCGRVVASIGGPFSRWLLEGLKASRQLYRQVTPAAAPTEPVVPGAAGYLDLTSERAETASGAIDLAIPGSSPVGLTETHSV